MQVSVQDHITRDLIQWRPDREPRRGRCHVNTMIALYPPSESPRKSSPPSRPRVKERFRQETTSVTSCDLSQRQLLPRAPLSLPAAHPRNRQTNSRQAPSGTIYQGSPCASRAVVQARSQKSPASAGVAAPLWASQPRGTEASAAKSEAGLADRLNHKSRYCLGLAECNRAA